MPDPGEGFVNWYHRAQLPDFWALTRQSLIVVAGTVTAVDTNVLLSVTNVLKGSVVPPTVVFPRPPTPSLPRGVMIRDGPRVLRFVAGEPWLVFLKAGGSNMFTLLDATQGDVPGTEQAVKDVLDLDSLADRRAKCVFLINLVNSTRTYFFRVRIERAGAVQ